MENPFFNYNIDSLSFLERAGAQLALFDAEENISCLLYAALELRLGIESLFHSRLDAVHDAEGTVRRSKKEYAPKKLKNELLTLRPDAGDESFFYIGRHGSQEITGFRYQPITDKLTTMLASLGGLLHFSLFNAVTEWYVREPLDIESKETLKPYRRMLQDIVEELEKCSNSDLIIPAQIKHRSR